LGVLLIAVQKFGSNVIGIQRLDRPYAISLDVSSFAHLCESIMAKKSPHGLTQKIYLAHQRHQHFALLIIMCQFNLATLVNQILVVLVQWTQRGHPKNLQWL
jgi:hypothetical protein